MKQKLRALGYFDIVSEYFLENCSFYQNLRKFEIRLPIEVVILILFLDIV